MKSLRFAALSLALAVLPLTSAGVLAADVAQPDNNSWSGVYIGAFAGWYNEHADVSVNDVVFGTASSGSKTPTELSLTNDAFSGGAFLGYQMQLDRFVLGAEGDINFRNGEFSSTYNYPGSVEARKAPASTDVDFKSDYLITLRARAGILLTDSFLLYGTGGVAFKSYDVSINTTNNCCGGDYSWKGSNSEMNTGYAVGGGAEYKVHDNWNLRVEYLYVGMPDIDVNTSDDASNKQKFTVKSSEQQVRAGVSYTF